MFSIDQQELAVQLLDIQQISLGDISVRLSMIGGQLSVQYGDLPDSLQRGQIVVDDLITTSMTLSDIENLAGNLLSELSWELEFSETIH